MTDYPYRMQLAEDASAPGYVARDAVLTFYAPTDTELASPLVLKDPSGLPFANPTTTTTDGYVKPFVAQIEEVMWHADGRHGYLTSYTGLKAEAVSAAEGALEAASSAGAAASAASGALTAAIAAQEAAETAAATATGGGMALDPADPDTLILTTKTDGSVIVDPTDADVFVITT